MSGTFSIDLLAGEYFLDSIAATVSFMVDWALNIKGLAPLASHTSVHCCVPVLSAIQ